MKRAVIMLLALLCCAACGRGEPPSPATLRADTTPESLIEELTQRYDLPESLLLQSAADLAALLQIKEKALLSGCGRIAIEEGNPCQLLLVQAAPGKAEAAPAEVFLDRELPDRALLEQLLREHRGKKIQFTVPQRGESRKLCQMAQPNAAQELARDTNRTGRESAALTELGRLLGLSHPPDYIEAFDISNIGGSTIVGGMTVFRRGRPEKRLYK